MSKGKASGRLLLFTIHSWLGFHLAALLLTVLLSGTLAVLGDEIDWLLQPEMRVTPGESEPLGWSRMEAAVRAAARGDILFSLSAGEGDRFAYRALLVDEGGKTYYLYVDQWTGDVVRAPYSPSVQRFLRDLHRYLFLPQVIGLPIVCALAFAMLASLYTGLKFLGKWRAAAVRLRLRGSARMAVGDFHKAAGIWSSVFIVIIAVTGLWYLGEFGVELAGGRFEPDRPLVPEKYTDTYGRTLDAADADALVSAAMSAFPGLHPREIQFSTRPNRPAYVLGRGGDPFVRDRANRVFLEPATANVIKVQRSTEIGAAAYINELADPLHFGSFGNLATKLIWFVFGLALTGLAVSGFWLRLQRLKRLSPSLAQAATLLVLFSAAVFGYEYVQARADTGLPAFERAMPARQIDGISVVPFLSTDESGAFDGSVRVVVNTADGRLNLAAATLQIDAPGGDAALAFAVFQGRRAVLGGSLPEAALRAAGTLDVTLRFVSGETLEYRWALE